MFMTNSKFCSKCGEEISLNAKFCLKCGARQEKFEENSSSSVNKELGKGFNLEISTFKELKKAENQFDFSFFRYRRFGNIIVSTHQTCTSILENMLRVVGGFSRFFGSGKLLFDKKIDINSITSVTRIKNWDKYNLILGSIMLFIALICLFTAEIWYFLGWALVGGLVIYNARGMKLSIHQTNGEQTAFQTWNLGDEQKFITELKKINLNITENLENLNLNNVLDNETIENLKEKIKKIKLKKQYKFLILGTAFFLLFIMFFLINNNDSENTKIIKNLVLKYDKSTTLEKVVESYPYFKSGYWEDSITEGGADIVVYTAQIKDPIKLLMASKIGKIDKASYDLKLAFAFRDNFEKSDFYIKHANKPAGCTDEERREILKSFSKYQESSEYGKIPFFDIKSGFMEIIFSFNKPILNSCIYLECLPKGFNKRVCIPCYVTDTWTLYMLYDRLSLDEAITKVQLEFIRGN